MSKKLKTAKIILVWMVITVLAFSSTPLTFASSFQPTQDTQPTQPTQSDSPLAPTPPTAPGSTNDSSEGIDNSSTTPTDPAVTPENNETDSNLDPPQENNNSDLNNTEGQNQTTLGSSQESNNSNFNTENNSSDPQNTNTGANSQNTALVDTENETDITNENQAEIENTVEAGANSGGNETNYNTGNGTINTGDANILLDVINFLNTTFVILPGGAASFIFLNIVDDLLGNILFDSLSGEYYTLTGSRTEAPIASNADTGTNSENSSIINSKNKTEIKNNNDGNIDNNFDLSANTGGNQASYNTGNGSVTTGDANVSLNLLNFLNSNFIVSTLGIFGILNIFGSWQGDLLLPKILLGEEESQNTSIVVNNQNTGANSTNDASANIENSLDIDNDNKADIKNNLDINGNTGGNTADFNTGNGSVTSGNSNILLNLLTAANKNFIGDAILFVLVNVLGTWTGDILFPSNYLDGFSSNSNGQNISTQNSQTGANSSNYSELNLSDSTEIENTNDGVLNNDININTNTGENSANYNTGSGTINSGDTNVITNIFNFLNLNVIAKKFVFLVVNVFGSWTGNIDVEKEVISSSNSESQISSFYNSQEQGHIKSEVKVTINSEGEVISSPSYHSSNQNQGQENSSETTSFELSSGNNNSIVGSSNHSGDPEETGNSFIGFIKQNLKIIMAILVVLYLIFLDIYLKRRKKAKSV